MPSKGIGQAYESFKVFLWLSNVSTDRVFLGIDTCTASSYGRFDLPNSFLLNESESRSLFNRHDIDIYLQTLQKEKIISEAVAKSKIDMAQSFSSTFDYNKYYKGATYVSLEASVMLQNEGSSREIKATINKIGLPDVCVSFNRYWPGEFIISKNIMVIIILFIYYNIYYLMILTSVDIDFESIKNAFTLARI